MIMDIFSSSFIADSFYFNKGRIALYAILKSMGIKSGDEVILQGFTCVAVPLPIIQSGATPLYVDIENDGYNINVDLIEKKITPSTKAIIVQHTYGIPADINHILEIARKHNLYVIEDCCHSLSSRIGGKFTGEWGDAAFYSYEWGKPIIVGTGGSAIINNKAIKNEMTRIYPDFKSPSALNDIIILAEYFFHKFLRRPSLFWLIRKIYRLLSRFKVAIGTFNPREIKSAEMVNKDKNMGRMHKKRLISKLKPAFLKKDIELRKKIAQEYENALLENGIIKSKIKTPPDADVCYLRYPLIVKNKVYILNSAMKRQIELGNWFVSPVHPLKENEWEVVRYLKGDCPNAEETAQHIITLPIYDKITPREIKKIMRFLKDMSLRGAI